MNYNRQSLAIAEQELRHDSRGNPSSFFCPTDVPPRRAIASQSKSAELRRIGGHIALRVCLRASRVVDAAENMVEGANI
jgi:hypothetical protein